MSDKMVLVTGATGQQGGAVARHLLKNGWRVHALVRDPSKEAAQALTKQGAELVQGDLYDRSSVEVALKSAYGVFSVQNFWLKDVGYEGEVQQGVSLAEAAATADIEHFVYSSVGAAHRGMGQKHFQSKWIIEQRIKELSLPHTIVRPVAFMDNYNWTRPQISNGFLRSWGLRPDKTQQLVAVDDIGAFVAIILDNPQEFEGKTIEFAGDELSERQIAETLGRVIGRRVEVRMPEMRQDSTPTEEQIAMFQFFNGEGYTADIAAVRGRYPRLHTFEQYLRETGWENLPVMPLPPDGDEWGS